MIQVQLSFKTRQFYQKVYEILHGNEDTDIYFYFKQIEIVYLRDEIIKELPLIEKEFNKQLLNTKIINSLNSQAQNLFNKDREGWKENTYLPDMYVYAQELLTEELIRLSENEHNEEDAIAELYDLALIDDDMAELEDIWQ